MRNLAYRLTTTLVVSLLIATPLQVLWPQSAEAADFTSRRLDLSDTRAATPSDHTLSFNWISALPVGSMTIEYCSTSPLFVVACVPPIGMDLTSGAAFSSESGETGFSVHPSTTANMWVLTRPAAAVTPQPGSYLFTNVDNPTTEGSYYVRFASYASTDGTGSRIDEGGIAFSINTPLDIGAFVPPVLLFCLGTSIPTNSCSSAVGSSIDFGEFSTSSTAQGTTQMLAATNGVGGYNITLTGTTMTSGNNVIPGLASPTTSQQGVSQFGTNLVDNSVPNIGANSSGSGSGSPTADYNNVNQFKFVDGDIVASSPISTDINRYTSSYIVNISEDQNPGVYATTLTYVAFANF